MGGSLAITLPRHFVVARGIQEGDYLVLVINHTMKVMLIPEDEDQQGEPGVPARG